MSSISDPQRLVEVVAHTMFRDATRRRPVERDVEAEDARPQRSTEAPPPRR